MENKEKVDISKYVDMLVRRKYWLIISFMVVFLAGVGYLLNAPKIYESSTLILVQAQKVPQDFVRSIVTSDAEDRLRTITQQVTSRTNLEGIIKKFNLYESKDDRGMLIDDKVRVLRRNILINVAASGNRGGNAFSISFRGEVPQKVMLVTNALASNFISENLKIRESQALGTSYFLADELDSVKKELMGKEEQLKKYKEKYMGGLPEQLNSNLRILESLQGQLERLTDSLSASENRKLVLEQNLAVTSEKGLDITKPIPEGRNSLAVLKARLASLLTRYTEKYPDVINLRKQIAALEKEMAQKSDSDENTSPSAEVDSSPNPQLAAINLEIASEKNDIEKLKKEIKIYQARVEKTPDREQELLSLNRDYGNLRNLYDSMLNRKLEASISVSMEKKQKGEQFMVIDPAKVPVRPISPDARKIMLITMILGLGIGCGLIYLTELLDTSYRSPEDAEKDLSVPVLISLPFLMTPKEIKRKKINNIIFAASLYTGFVIVLAGIVLSAKGLHATINYITGIFSGV